MDPKTLQLAQQVVRDNPGANRIELVKAMKATGHVDPNDAIVAIDFALRTPSAGDLPIGTVVARAYTVYLKLDYNMWSPSGQTRYLTDETIDGWLAASAVQILRVGV